MVLGLVESAGRIESTLLAGGHSMNILHDLGLLTLSDVAEVLHRSKAHSAKRIRNAGPASCIPGVSFSLSISPVPSRPLRLATGKKVRIWLSSAVCIAMVSL